MNLYIPNSPPSVAIILVVAITSLFSLVQAANAAEGSSYADQTSAAVSQQLPEKVRVQALQGYGIGVSGLVAGRDYVAGQLIVGLVEGRTSQFVASAGASVAGQINGTALLLDFGSELAALKSISALLANKNVSFVERNGIMSIPPMPLAPRKNGVTSLMSDPEKLLGGKVGSQSVSTDPATGHQWHQTVIRKTATPAIVSANPPTIAVIDTGVDYTHQDLAGKVILGGNYIDSTSDPFDDHGHGTHVAGLAAAKSGNGVYGEGVSHNSKIYAVKVLSNLGSGTTFGVAQGMHDAHLAVTVPPIRVGNMSIGGPASLLIAAEATHWKSAGKLLVVAAGNSNNTGVGTFNTDPNIGLRVMATTQEDCRTYFSNFSPALTPNLFNIAAPGWQTPSTLPNQSYGPMSGTSMASPVVAGGAALIWGQFSTDTLAQIIARLVTNGQTVSCGFAAPTRRLDVRKALFPLTGETVVNGRLLDSVSAQPPSQNTVAATVQVKNGATILGTDLTNSGGMYEVFGVTLPGVSRNIAVSKPGYITDMIRMPVTVTAGVPTGRFTDAVNRARPAGYFHGSLDWSTAQPTSIAAGPSTMGWELDLGIRLPSGVVYPFGPSGDLIQPPYVQLPRDSFLDLVPIESFVIAPSAAVGIYKISVDRFFGPAALPLNASRAKVRFYNAATSGFFLNAPACTAANRFWHVANITKTGVGVGSTYAVAIVNTCVAVRP